MNIQGLTLELQILVLVNNPAIYECRVYYIIKNIDWPQRLLLVFTE